MWTTKQVSSHSVSSPGVVNVLQGPFVEDSKQRLVVCAVLTTRSGQPRVKYLDYGLVQTVTHFKTLTLGDIIVDEPGPHQTDLPATFTAGGVTILKGVLSLHQ